MIVWTLHRKVSSNSVIGSLKCGKDIINLKKKLFWTGYFSISKFTETQDHTLEQCKSPIVNNLILMSDSQPITQFQLSQQIIQPSLSNYQLTQSQILAMPNMQSANTISSNMFTQSQFFVTNSQPTLTITTNMQYLNAISSIILPHRNDSKKKQIPNIS
ncbi:unnamed protein product [Gordionus sp. m RMFG-2023]